MLFLKCVQVSSRPKVLMGPRSVNQALSLSNIGSKPEVYIHVGGSFHLLTTLSQSPDVSKFYTE